MAMNLQLQVGQQLTMTPQLQHAIKLLQMSAQELEQNIQDELTDNPLLELVDNIEEEQNHVNAQTTQSNLVSSGESLDQLANVAYVAEAPLKNTLHWQRQLSGFNPLDNEIARTLIDYIDEHGFLQADNEIILQALISNTAVQELVDFKDEDNTIEYDEIEAVRKRIQHFEPSGCGSINTREYMLWQCSQSTDALAPLAMRIINDELVRLTQPSRRQKLAKSLKITVDELSAAESFIKNLHTYPAFAFADTPVECIIPDARFKKTNDEWVVELNRPFAPQIAINSAYANLLQRGDTSDDAEYIREHLQRARTFISGLKARDDTLVKVLTAIAQKQTAFLEHGLIGLKPMTLLDIAEKIDMHESSISRISTNKYISTPHGTYPFKYFFSNGIATNSGQTCSTRAIKHLLKELISAEPVHKPLSDQQLTNILEGEGIEIARRTVAKYREALGILPACRRKLSAQT